MDNYNSPRQSELCKSKKQCQGGKKLKIKESIAFSQSRETIQDRNYRNETQAIDSKAIYREQAESSSYKEHKVNALASGADEGRD